MPEQRAAIEAFAVRNSLHIGAWFEEKETAAKQGRRLFSRMLDRLSQNEADGVIIHKIDRSARNLRDWANLGDLIDRGIDVKFVHDNLDLRSRGGRLSADIQAVVAADFIRNLRDEVRKGFYGRLKQGFYPLPAPPGYLDRGKAQAKVPDPVKAPLVRQAFELYGQNRMSLWDLHAELTRRGLRGRSGETLSLNGLSKMLHNPFYVGLVRIKRTNETFPGIHTPIVPMALFDRVQTILKCKTYGKVVRHDFTFRRFIRCGGCKYHLVGERKKGRYVYYRCFNAACRGAVMREQDVDAAFEELLGYVRLSTTEIRDIGGFATRHLKHREADIENHRNGLRMRLATFDERLARLTDALLDGLITKDVFEERRHAVLRERQSILETLSTPDAIQAPAEGVLRYLELRDIKESSYKIAIPSERRDIAEVVTWNFEVHGKNPAITLKSPYQEIVNWRKSLVGEPSCGTLGTASRQLFDILMVVAGREQISAVTTNGDRGDMKKVA